MLALRGADSVLKNARPIAVVAIHTERMKPLGTAPRELIAYISGLGYVASIPDGRLVEESGFEELIFLPVDENGGR